MPKILKFDNCSDCLLPSWQMNKIKCPLRKYAHIPGKFPKDSIHKDCPLEDYNLCDCQPFHSHGKKVEIELLKHCADIFEEMDAINWDEGSSWQTSSYVEISEKVYQLLNDGNYKKKTDWIDISIEKPLFGKRYWIMDKNNNIEMADFESHTEKGYGFFKFNTMDLSGLNVVMFAEIKPPSIP